MKIIIHGPSLLTVWTHNNSCTRRLEYTREGFDYMEGPNTRMGFEYTNESVYTNEIRIHEWIRILEWVLVHEWDSNTWMDSNTRMSPCIRMRSEYTNGLEYSNESLYPNEIRVHEWVWILEFMYTDFVYTSSIHGVIVFTGSITCTRSIRLAKSTTRNQHIKQHRSKHEFGLVWQTGFRQKW
jgi:hypothetical protein